MSEQFRDQLKLYKKKQGIKTPHPKERKRKRKAEKLSEGDIKDLMVMNRPTYSRGRGGAYKQK